MKKSINDKVTEIYFGLTLITLLQIVLSTMVSAAVALVLVSNSVDFKYFQGLALYSLTWHILLIITYMVCDDRYGFYQTMPRKLFYGINVVMLASLAWIVHCENGNVGVILFYVFVLVYLDIVSIVYNYRKAKEHVKLNYIDK